MEDVCQYALEMRGITKRFSNVEVLSKIDFSVRQGETHALLGENGAGKSTLMKIIMGLYSPNEGEMYFNGEKIEPKSPSDALKIGISMIYQELNVLPHLTIAENIFMGREPQKGILIDRRKMNEDTRALMKEFKLDLSPQTPMRNLSIAQAQVVEIIKAVSYDSKMVIMDEPTSSLTAAETEELYLIIERLKKRGVSVIYISHRLEELLIVADRVTVFRDGHKIATHNMCDVTKAQMIEEMVGRPLVDLYPKAETTIGDVMLEVKGLSRKGVIDDISFQARKGEILGFSGLVGAGRTETARAIFGMDPFDAGQILLEGKELRIRCPKDAIDNGIVMASEDRKQVGLVLCQSVRSNISLPNLDKIRNAFVLNRKKERRMCQQAINDVLVKTASMEQPVSSLSGGNQQKVVLAKWLLANPKVIILDEPTRGVDVGAKAEIYRIISKLAAEGRTVILISSDMPEIIGMCDRVLVLFQGKITGEFHREDIVSGKVGQQELLSAAIGG